MSTIKANIIDSSTSATEFKDPIAANGDKQWLDNYGIIKTNRNTINENITIPVGTNGFSAGAVAVVDGYTVDIQGEWVIV
jgi:hypothetical protein